MQTISFEVDDMYYQELVNQVSKENFAVFFTQISEPYLNPKFNNHRPYRLGALTNINIPDNFDDIEITDFDI